MLYHFQYSKYNTVCINCQIFCCCIFTTVVDWSGVQESNPHSRGRSSMYYPLYERQMCFILKLFITQEQFNFCLLCIRLSCKVILCIDADVIIIWLNWSLAYITVEFIACVITNQHFVTFVRSNVLCSTAWGRTRDIQINSLALYQLSYCGIEYTTILVPPVRLEQTTF